jgi:hypothetical protein
LSGLVRAGSANCRAGCARALASKRKCAACCARSNHCAARAGRARGAGSAHSVGARGAGRRLVRASSTRCSTCSHLGATCAVGIRRTGATNAVDGRVARAGLVRPRRAGWGARSAGALVAKRVVVSVAALIQGRVAWARVARWTGQTPAILCGSTLHALIGGGWANRGNTCNTVSAPVACWTITTDSVASWCKRRARVFSICAYRGIHTYAIQHVLV